jgi:hypothetical protein
MGNLTSAACRPRVSPCPSIARSCPAARPAPRR